MSIPSNGAYNPSRSIQLTEWGLLTLCFKPIVLNLSRIPVRTQLDVGEDARLPDRQAENGAFEEWLQE
jgi:hypothetical protein